MTNGEPIPPIARFKDGNRYIISEGNHRMAAALELYKETGNQQQVRANNLITTTTYQYDENDRLLKEKENGSDKVIYTYDNNGNTLTKTENGETTESIWNDQNRLSGAKVKDINGSVIQQVDYEYDVSGIRVSQDVDGEITKYLIDANLPYAQAVVEYRPSGLVIVSYTHGNDLISQTRDGGSSFYHVDGLGSTRALSDGNGNLIDTYSYQAFGELLNSSGGGENNYLFAGEQFDPVLGDYYNRARYYDPHIQEYTKKSVGQQKSLLSQPGFAERAIDALIEEKSHIAKSVLFKQLVFEGDDFVKDFLSRKDSKYAFFAPSIINMGFSTPTGLMISGKPLVITSNSKAYRLFGVGMLAGTTKNNLSKMQFFRMDYGPYNHEVEKGKNHDVWQSRTKEFHFHVPKIKNGDA
jgi:RHS repeat-associated protein